LDNSIRENGLYVPIATNPDGVFLDGHHRYEVCIKLSIGPKYQVKSFETPFLEKKFVIESNLTRRYLTTFQRIKMALPLIKV
jgi:ParB-like chromosome segregation protein Spo0J